MSRDTLKKKLLELYASGKRVDEICAEYDVPKSTFYRWIRKSRVRQPEISDDDIRVIATRINRLEEEATTYKKVLQLLKQSDCK